MQYLLLIYQNEADLKSLREKEKGAFYGEYMTFTESITKSGHFRGGSGLQPVATATTVRVRDGKAVTTDGPFAETKEQLGGYYWIEAKDMDDAIAIAARVPSARFGSVEVRPLMQ
jgi:hypothetical protein